MNSDRMKRAMRDAFSALKSMDPTKLHNQIMEHVGGQVAELLIGSGMFEGRLEAAHALMHSPPALGMIVNFTDRVVDYIPHAVKFSSTYVDIGTFEIGNWHQYKVGYANIPTVDFEAWDLMTPLVPYAPGIEWMTNVPLVTLTGRNWTYHTWEIHGSGEEANGQEEMEWTKAA